ncbi:MAG TPA: ABC transporter ATP-binding protein [Methylomirabilota bacterium]|nr:ABC transporter ATP-binding protein [Methylomirabilota bacterium]
MTQPKANARSLLGILAFLGKYPGRVMACLTLLLANIAIEMTLPQILGHAVTGLRAHQTTGAPYAVWPPTLLFLALVILRAGIGYVLGPIRNRTIQSTLADIRAAIYNALQRLDFGYHDKSNTGELISRCTTDVWRLQDFLFACLLLSVDIAVALTATTVLIFHASTALGLVALGTMLPTVVLIALYARKLQPQWRHVHDLHGAMTTVIQENIAGVRVVKAFAREQGEIGKFRGKRDEYLGTLLQTINYWASRVPRAQFLYGLSTPLVLWIGGRQVINGELPLGDLAKVLFYLMAIGHRVGMVGQFTNILQNASASAERVLEIIREPPGITSGRQPLPPGRGEVTFEGVSFAHTGDRASLQDISFIAQPGQTVAIVGPTGSGKTTLVNLIPRFYDPTAGRVLVDGVDVRDVDLRQLRRAVSVIFQETFLFSASVAENIAYGRPESSRAEIEACARAAQAHEFITGLENGYDTIIGERGISLSGGQRQRIAIARAFLVDPRILILDDATASVDSRTERLLQEAMRKLCQGRTTFVIAQRISTVKHADVILVLKEGRIVEQGRHEELLRGKGFYADLVRQQLRP